MDGRGLTYESWQQLMDVLLPFAISGALKEVGKRFKDLSKLTEQLATVQNPEFHFLSEFLKQSRQPQRKVMPRMSGQVLAPGAGSPVPGIQ